MYQIPFNPRPPRNCGECGHLADCGGLEGDAFSKGCFARCTEYCQHHGCDLACPCLHLTFPDLLQEAGGLWAPPQRPLVEFNHAHLPPYVAQIDHGGRRDTALREEIVAVPLYALVGRDRRGKYGVRYNSREAIRDALRISQRTAIIVTSAVPDHHLEDFWEAHVQRGILARLAQLGILAMTVPNFSFMLDVPRLNSLRNLSRLFRVAERMSDAGIATILHLQASTRRDWERWARVLLDHRQATCVALEFQTGTSRRETGDRYYSGLLALQNALGRSLHPLVMAGAGRMKNLQQDFRSFTVVDSMPFIKTMKRRELIRLSRDQWKWRFKPTMPLESLSLRLAQNISAHRTRLLERSGAQPGATDQQLLLSSAA